MVRACLETVGRQIFGRETSRCLAGPSGQKGVENGAKTPKKKKKTWFSIVV